MQDSFEWTYPASHDILNVADSVELRWQGTARGIGQIELQLDQRDWEILVSNVELSTHHFKWKVPSTFSKGRLRVLFNGQYIESDEFMIAPLIQHDIGFNCEDEVLLQWPGITSAEGYRIYAMGSQYLEPIAETIDTIFVISKANNQTRYYAVAPYSGSTEGNHSLSLNYESQGVECYYRNFFARNVDNEYIELELNVTTTYNVAELRLERSLDTLNYEALYSTTNIYSNNLIVQDKEPLGEFSYYRALIVLDNGTEIIVDEKEVFFPNANSIMVFPNPVPQNDFFTVYAKGEEGAKLELLDLTGTVIRQWYLNTNVDYFEVPHNAQKGIYILKVQKGSKTMARKRIMVY